MNYIADDGRKLHLLILRPGIEPGMDSLSDRTLLFPVMSCQMEDGLWTVRVEDKQKLITLQKFRPQLFGCLMVTEGTEREFKYCKFKGMAQERSVWNTPTTIKFSVQSL